MSDERSEYDVESLRVTRAEAREALNHQIDALNDIDDKAAHTLRLNVLLFGIVLTLASVMASSDSTPAIGRMVNGLVVAGAVASAVSMLTSIWAYTSRTYRPGTGPSDVRGFLSHNPPEGELLAVLLDNYAAWMERNSRLNRRDGFILFVSHVCLFLAMGYYTSGVVFGLYAPRTRPWVSISAAVVLGVSMGASVFAVRHHLATKVLRTVRNAVFDKH